MTRKMKRFIALVLSLLACSKAYSAGYTDVSAQICYTDVQLCAVVAVDKDRGWLTEIRLRPEDFAKLKAVDPNAPRAFLNQAGVLVREFSNYDSMVQNLPTYYQTMATDLSALDDISPEAWNAMKDGFGCFAGAVTCVTSVQGAMATGGLALLGSKVACAYTGWKCADAVRSYEIWSSKQAEIRAEDMADDGAGGRGDGSAMGGGDPGRPAEASPGGFERPTIDDGRPGRGAIITGRETSPRGSGSPMVPTFQN
jgi:hypothetical protein